MGTLVCFHAHPDDESIATSGLMAAAVAAGHRVVLVVATRGELGEIVPGVLDDGEQLGVRRTAETYASAASLGVARVEFLGYLDSGMVGEASNDAPGCFWQADVDHAAARLALILREEQADLLTAYDHHGGYGHPDHIQVHRVGLRAAELVEGVDVLQNTMNRTRILELMEAARQDPDLDLPGGPDDGIAPDFGTPIEEITHSIDVTVFTEAKRTAMRCHRSQMADDHFLLSLPDEAFAATLGVEWYIGRTDGPPVGGALADLFTLVHG
jgi:LmbE family N-acetylglucosaminyl deacetylase